MIQQLAGLSDDALHKLQQGVKWTVYTLLIINFVFYVVEDWDRAIHTLTPASTFLDWTSEFANSIDLVAWFLLLAMFELETYVLEDKDWTGWVARLVHGVRIACFVMIAHTVFAYANTVIKYEATVPVENVSSLCDMVDNDVAFVRSLRYTEVNAETCGQLSTASQFYWLGTDPVVTDMPGLELERDLAMADLIEAVVWLFILLAIELVVRLQGRSITGGALMSTVKTTKLLLYMILVAIAVYWATLSHWLYVWDEFVWVAGFFVIEMNISEWREELLDEQVGAAEAGASNA